MNEESKCNAEYYYNMAENMLEKISNVEPESGYLLIMQSNNNFSISGDCSPEGLTYMIAALILKHPQFKNAVRKSLKIAISGGFRVKDID